MKEDIRAAIRTRLDGCDWAGARSSLFERGFATLPRLLSDAECDAQLKLYGDEHRFRKTVDMARHNFGEGEYKYFADPLPPLVAGLRGEAYRRLAPIANAMESALRRPPKWPASLPALRKLCAASGQPLPTPLLLQRGDAVIFATADRPRRGTRGFHRAAMRHGVATVTRGERFTLGVIFHDAKS